MSLRSVLAIPESSVTNETVYRRRRQLLGAMAAAPLLPLAGCADAEPRPPSSVRVTPAQAGAGFTTDEPLTRYEDITGYNNFYEFGTGKSDPSRAPKTLRTAPWHVEVSGECERPGTLALDDLLHGIAPTERIYRLRCVEGWSMVVPWLGVLLGDGLCVRADPKAKYAFTSLADPADAGRALRSIDWSLPRGLYRRGDASARIPGHRSVRRRCRSRTARRCGWWCRGSTASRDRVDRRHPLHRAHAADRLNRLCRASTASTATSTRR